MKARRRHAGPALLLCACACVAIAAVQAQAPRTSTANMRNSDAEKTYTPPDATTRVAETPRKTYLRPVYGKKFSATENSQGEVTITNPYMDPDRIFFAKAAAIACTADGGLIVGGRAGLDAELHAVGTGYWKVATDGAVTPFHTRSTGAYAKTHGTKCDAPYGKTALEPAPFALAPDGSLLTILDYAVTRIESDGYVSRVAGAPFACEEDGQPSKVRGLADGGPDAARFNMLSEIALDPHGNIWLTDQSECALRRIAPDGQVTTVIPPEKACVPSAAPEDRLGLRHLAWDAAHGELVGSRDFSVALPIHDWYTTVWRIKPTGEFRRVLFVTKGGRGPTKIAVDGILTSLTVDPQGQIHYGTHLMRTSSPLLVVRVDEAKGTVVPVTGAKFRPGESAELLPRDGPAGRAYFRKLEGMCFAPDGTLFAIDEHMVRKMDKGGLVSTWLF